MCSVSQDIVHLCVFVRVDIKSTKACEKPPCCTQQTWRLGLFLLGTRGPTATQHAGSSCISANGVFTSTYYYKASYYQGATRLGDKPIYGDVPLNYATGRAAKPREAFGASRGSLKWNKFRLSAAVPTIPYY